MEKEIKVRKRRFAAFWIVVLSLCGMVVPMAVNAVDDNGVLTDSETTLEAGTRIRAGTIVYQDSDETELRRLSQESGGWQTIAEYSSFKEIPAEYQFEGWSVVGKGEKTENSGEEYGNVTYHTSVTLKANLKLKEFQITFDTDGGNTIEPITAVAGAPITEPADPEKDGCIFAGWIPEIPETMPVNGLQTKAQWTPKEYKISYEVYDGTHTNTATSYTYGVGVESFTAAEKDGYTFAGWYSDAEFTKKVESISKTDTGDITLYAKFELNSGKVGKGTYYLKKNTQYQLDGVTKVNDDSSTYKDGSIFYVPADGNYTFH